MVAVKSIGAGGGSIARLDHGALLVGPESAGADPGPACYGRGGTAPTVTDANLVLGYLDANRTLGGDVSLDIEAARAAIAPLAQAMDMKVETAALGILRVANAAMVRALRQVTVERGIDGRQCTLLAFGGAGPMHAAEVARGFGMSCVIIPGLSSVFSALGCVSAQMSYAQQQTVRMSAQAWDVDRLAAIRGDLTARLQAPILAAGHGRDDIVVEEVAALRYSGQSYAIDIDSPAFDDPVGLGQAFLAHHRTLYGFATDEPWELLSIRQRVSLTHHAAVQTPIVTNNAPAQPTKTAPCSFHGGGTVATPRYDRAHLSVDLELRGPAVIEDAWSTIVVPPGATVTPDHHGNLIMEVGEAP